ncbi:MAG TPA: DUF5953 family protein [Archangium sp.]|nr:DUF5953 family protein [Archangium sp.]
MHAAAAVMPQAEAVDAGTCAGILAFPDPSRDAELLSRARRTATGGWVVRLTDAPLDLDNPAQRLVTAHSPCSSPHAEGVPGAPPQGGEHVVPGDAGRARGQLRLPMTVQALGTT